jgi:hypothetical protein
VGILLRLRRIVKPDIAKLQLQHILFHMPPLSGTHIRNSVGQYIQSLFIHASFSRKTEGRQNHRISRSAVSQLKKNGFPGPQAKPSGDHSCFPAFFFCTW